MNKEYLIKKWLDNELSSEELLEFQQLEEYDSYIKLSEKASFFKAPDFNAEAVYDKILPLIEAKRNRKAFIHKFRPYMQVAAVLIVGLVVFSMFFTSNTTNIETLAMQHKTINLPDASVVALNAMSSLSFDEKEWAENREVSLSGEAFFKVEKGSQFNVKTSSGIVTVVGTQFNVKNRNDYFEVKCFEGKVNVIYNGDVIPLPAGQTIRVMNKMVYHNDTELTHPTWIDNISSFKSVPLFEVIAELERQYNLKVKIESDFDMSMLYSGTFVHNNKELAIQSIAVPFGMDYTIINNVVILNKIE